MSHEQVVLTGFMGTGKSTVGVLLAERLGWEACDTDDLIAERNGPVAEIFIERGEEAFRDLEREIVKELAQRKHLVISTGGRLLVDERNAALLGGGVSSSGVGSSDSGASGSSDAVTRVFCLTAEPDEIAKRIVAEAGEATSVSRPLLDQPNQDQQSLLERITKLLAERAEAYAKYEQVRTDGKTPEQVADEIWTLLA